MSKCQFSLITCGVVIKSEEDKKNLNDKFLPFWNYLYDLSSKICSIISFKSKKFNLKYKMIFSKTSDITSFRMMLYVPKLDIFIYFPLYLDLDNPQISFKIKDYFNNEDYYNDFINEFLSTFFKSFKVIKIKELKK